MKTHTRGSYFPEKEKSIEGRVEINKYLTEKVAGSSYEESPWFTNYYTPEGFFKLWEWAIEQKWWDTFVYAPGDATQRFNIGLISPSNFAKSIYEFLKERE